MSDQCPAPTTPPLCAHPLNERERVILLTRIGDLLKFLGSPGDWGYGTQLGELTVQLTWVQRNVHAADVRSY